MPIWLYLLGSVVIISIVAVNVWHFRLPAAERKRLDDEIQDDMRNFSM